MSGSTLGLIHAAAMAEFMEKGFKSASLRNIVKTAGVTTGAFYGYYDSKEALFEALVGTQYSHVMDSYRQAHADFVALPTEEQPVQMGKISGGCMEEMLVYMQAHRDEMHLILLHSDGTRFSSMIDEMVEIELEATHEYYKVLEQLGRPVPDIDEKLEHILITGMFNAYFEIIIHDMPQDDARLFLRELNDFYTAGWMKIMGQ